jgi:hypothetical protein
VIERIRGPLKGFWAPSIGFENALKDYPEPNRNVNLGISHPIRDLAEFAPRTRSKINIHLRWLTRASIPQRPRMRKDSSRTTRCPSSPGRTFSHSNQAPSPDRICCHGNPLPRPRSEKMRGAISGPSPPISPAHLAFLQFPHIADSYPHS